MKTDPSTRAPACRAALVLLACALLGGCSDPEERRASVEFHADAVRKTMEVLRRVVRLQAAGKLKEPHYDIPIAIDLVNGSLAGLPARVEAQAKTRVAERKAAAEKARELFAQLRPKLQSLKFEQAEINAKLDEILALIDEVEKE